MTFRAVRAKVFGDDERRRMADFRRSGATEALAGDASPEKLSTKMANTLSESNRLHDTYAPVSSPRCVMPTLRASSAGQAQRTKTGQKFPSAGPKVPPKRKERAK